MAALFDVTVPNIHRLPGEFIQGNEIPHLGEFRCRVFVTILVSNTLCALPGLALTMPHEAEVAAVATLAEGLRADEIDVMKVAVVDDVAAAEHGAEALQHTVLGEFVFVQALQRLEVIVLLGVFRMPGVLPSLARAVLEAQRDDLPHHRQEERQPGKLPEPLRIQCRPHVCRDEFEGFLRRLPVTLKHVVDGDGRKDVAEVAVVAFVLVIPLFLNEPGHPGKDFLLDSRV